MPKTQQPPALHSAPVPLDGSQQQCPFFNATLSGVGECEVFPDSGSKHRIDLLPDALPYSRSPYRYATEDKQFLETQVKKLLHQAVSSTSTGDVIKHLHNVFYTYGTPDHCLSDHGSAFKSNEFKRFMSLHSVELHFTTAYRPEGNGLVERSNGTLLAALRKICAMEPLSWPTKLQEAAFAVNTSMNASTNFTPFQLLYGYVPKIPLQQHHPFQHSALAERILDTTVQRSEAAANSEAAQGARKERYDRSHRSHTFTVGDMVWGFLK
ncbi:uncharacterized protein LOC119449117 [Dermacentor silvarum]|uniref:uncharacterized protein LOC119449117 n=1 Tax=Dermacentor silvarum TaxID=543639 RepID=UPI001896FB53|nr:uncharacterized protein LOC119449117 [Dermacentor silvarum]